MPCLYLLLERCSYILLTNSPNRYNDAIGYDGKMVTGTAPKSDGDTFESQQESTWETNGFEIGIVTW